MKSLEALQKAVDIAGGQTRLAEMIAKYTKKNIFQPHVWHWLNKGEGKVPAEYCAAIEWGTGVTRKELHPDDWQTIWPELTSFIQGGNHGV